MNNIILAGMPLCGKTTISAELGKLMGAEVVDTDAEIVKKYGCISDIFEKYGEKHFRQMEKEVVKEVCNLENTVISTGGGCLTDKENADELKKSGVVVYLRVGFETLVLRSRGDGTRPLLAGDAEKKLKALMNDRTPVYERVADFTIDCDGLSPEEIAKAISELIK